MPMLEGPVTRPNCPTHCGHKAPITSASLCGFSGTGDGGGAGAAAGAATEAGAADGSVDAACSLASCLALRADRLSSWSCLNRFSPGLEWRGSSATVSEPTHGVGDPITSDRAWSAPCCTPQAGRHRQLKTKSQAVQPVSATLFGLRGKMGSVVDSLPPQARALHPDASRMAMSGAISKASVPQMWGRTNRWTHRPHQRQSFRWCRSSLAMAMQLDRATPALGLRPQAAKMMNPQHSLMHGHRQTATVRKARLSRFHRPAVVQQPLAVNTQHRHTESNLSCRMVLHDE